MIFSLWEQQPLLFAPAFIVRLLYQTRDPHDPLGIPDDLYLING